MLGQEENKYVIEWGQLWISTGQSKQNIKSMAAVSHLVKKVTTVIMQSLLACVAVPFTCARTCSQTHPFLSKALKRGLLSHQTALCTRTAGCHITINSARGRELTEPLKAEREAQMVCI